MRGTPSLMVTMATDLAAPDLVMSLRLDPFAPRAARHCVVDVDHPSPDLRDAVMLLTSELVTRATQRCLGTDDEEAELRVWMPADVVRVELRTHRDLLAPARGMDERLSERLLRQVADRWSIENARDGACIWFEIDRHAERAQAA
jgi:hypothetical protein